MKPVLYTLHCPQCKALETMLKTKNIEFNIVDREEDVLFLAQKGFKSLPVLQVSEDSFLTFKEAISWMKEGQKNG